MSDPGPLTPRPYRIGLQEKIVLLVLACVGLPMLSIGYYLLERNQEVLGDRVREGLTNQLFRKATEIDEWMAQRLGEASSWSASFVVFEGVEALTRDPGDAPALRDLRDYLESVLGHYRIYESLFVVDLAGSVLAATREERLEDWGRQRLAEGSSDRGAVSPLYRSEWLGRATMLVLQPIKGRGKAGTIGYFVGRLDLRDLESHLGTPVDAETAFLALKLDAQQIESALASSTELTPSFWLIAPQGGIVAEAGKVLVRPGEERFPGELPDETTAVAPVREKEIRGLSVVYGVRRLQGQLQGYLAATLPEEAAYRSLRESRRRLLMYGGIALGLILLVTFLAAHQTLRPIHLLSDGATRVSAGEDVFLPVAGRDEIADLTLAFNDMVNKVRESRQGLEEARDELARRNEDLKAANRTLETLAITDGLTGLYNHRHFQDRIEQEIRRCDRENRVLSLLLIDIDHFKQYNDRFGHTEGDAALRRVAGQIVKSIRSTDMAFRYGGEEMAVLLPSCGKEQATEVAEKIRVAVAAAGPRPARFGAKNTVSLGVATFPEDGRVARALVDTADAALYEAKARGRDRVVQAGAHIPPKKQKEPKESESIG